MKYEIKKIDLWSAIKISFIAHACIGLVIGVLIGLFIALISGFIGSMMPAEAEMDFPAMALSPVAGFAIGIIYAVFLSVFNGIIITGIAVLLYNLLAGWLGGIKLEIESGQSESLDPTMTIADKIPPGGQTDTDNV